MLSFTTSTSYFSPFSPITSSSPMVVSTVARLLIFTLN
ncbi:hypothetical protein SLEP1_g12417 [Rubroshorea leprosula]|uniref:Uncharacterized protein n=1 Tax=Rubroshorea leprosula TaxID=152421 RepID=A0AAV5IIA3_9ROSI|nr:hypothetical protein SLEP1_g12417 [Rubroshorea leprosula]